MTTWEGGDLGEGGMTTIHSLYYSGCSKTSRALHVQVFIYFLLRIAYVLLIIASMLFLYLITYAVMI